MTTEPSQGHSQIRLLTVKTPYAPCPPPPAIKWHFCTFCVAYGIPSIGILGEVKYGQSGHQRPGSKAGRDIWDFPAATSCLTKGKLEAQDGQESDLRHCGDSLTLLPLQHHHDGGLPSQAHLTSRPPHNTHLPGDMAFVPIEQMRKLRLIEDK